MEPKRLSLGLLIAALVLMAVPSVRQRLMAVAASYGHANVAVWKEATLRRAIDAAPNDAQIWLGVAELRTFRLEAGQVGAEIGPATDAASVVQAYEKAIALDPKSPAARLRLALFHLDRSGSLTSLDTNGKIVLETSRSFDQRRRLGLAGPLLRSAMAAEPDNAACDYLMAWYLLAEGQDARAHGVLAVALGKERWDVHEREAALAACRVAERASIRPGLHDTAAYVRVDTAYLSGIRDLARLLHTEADERRVQGEDQEAIASYLAVTHLGGVVRRDAYTVMEGLVGVAIADMASASFAERYGSEDQEQVTQARIAGLESYLRGHGHRQEADRYVADMQAARSWNSDAHRFARVAMPYWLSELARAGAFSALGFLIAAGGVLLAFGLVAVVSVALGCWNEPRADPSFGYGGWALLLGLAIVPGQIAAFIGPRVSASGSTLTPAAVVLIAVSVASAVAWATVAGVVAARRRQAGRPRFRAALAGLRQLALPTLIALVLVALVLVPLVHHGLIQMEQGQMRAVAQGEVQYWGIGTGHVAPGSGGNPVGASP